LRDELFSIASSVTNVSEATFAIDDTIIAKKFAQAIEGIGTQYDSSDKNYIKGFSLVVIGIVHENTFFPLDFAIWYPKAITQDHYKSKQELANDLILYYHKTVGMKRIVMDGLYAHYELMNFLNWLGIGFVMRMHANRVVCIENVSQQLRNIKSLRPTKNS